MDLNFAQTKMARGIIPSLFLMWISACVADNVIPAEKAFKIINAAYLAKLDQCGQSPVFIIPVAHDVEESILLQCEGEILSGGCPISDQIPLSCALAVVKKPPAGDSDNR